tara:strand:- start:2735 stop:3184 length:450 start_codon:yes stop_codon:yes gene_type:complete
MDKIEEEYNKSLKEKNTIKTRTLRLVKSAVKDKEIELRSSDKSLKISEEDILKLLQNLIKKRNESIEMYNKGGRKNLAEEELEEIDVIKFFLPMQLSEEETKVIIEEIKKSENLSSVKDMGKLMNIIKSKYSGQIDLSLVAKLAKDLLK